MDFYINRNSTLPILKMELIHDGRNNYHKFYDMIQNADITFCMTDIVTGIKRVGNRDAICILKEPASEISPEEYYLGYKFTSKDTKKAGTFIGEFNINFLDGGGLLIVPIRENLKIHILENFK